MIPRDSHVTEPADVKRLTSQNAAVLARLQQGPVSNRELARISLKYTGRISDLRAAGYHIDGVRGYEPGLYIYTLVPEPVQEERPQQGHDLNDGFNLRG